MQHCHSQNLIKQLHQSITLIHQPIRSTSRLLSLYSLQLQQKQEQKITHQLYSTHSTHLKQTSQTQRKFSKFKGFSDKKVKIDQQGQSLTQCLSSNVKNHDSQSGISCFDKNKAKNVQKNESQYQSGIDVRSIGSQINNYNRFKRIKSMDDLYRNNGKHPKFIAKSSFLKVKLRQGKEQIKNGLKNEVENNRRIKRVERLEQQKCWNINFGQKQIKNDRKQKYCQNCNKFLISQYNLQIFNQQIKSICQRIKNQKQKLKKQMALFLENVLNFQNGILAELPDLMASFFQQNSNQKTSFLNFDYSLSQSISNNQTKIYSNNKQQTQKPQIQPTSPTTGVVKLFQDPIQHIKTCASQEIFNLQNISQSKCQLFNCEQKLYKANISKKLSHCQVKNKQATNNICSNTPKIQSLTQSYDFDLEEQIDTLFHKQLQQNTQQKVEGLPQNTLENIEERCQQNEQDQMTRFNSKRVTSHLIGEQFDWNKMMSSHLAAKQ